MLSLPLARELLAAGLEWQPQLHDFFAIPDRGLDDRTFVIADILAQLSLIHQWPAVTFHGAAEWALDYILASDVVWIPTEEQLRVALEAFITKGKLHHYALEKRPDAYACSLFAPDDEHVFTALSAPEAYARALIFLLRGNGHPGPETL